MDDLRAALIALRELCNAINRKWMEIAELRKKLES